MKFDEAKDEIERSFSIVAPRASAVRRHRSSASPSCGNSPELLKYLADRNIAVFSTDIDTFDFKRPPGGRPALVGLVQGAAR